MIQSLLFILVASQMAAASDSTSSIVVVHAGSAHTAAGPVHDGQALTLGDTVTIDNGGAQSTDIKLNSAHQLRLKPGSELKFGEMSEKKKIVLQLLKGTLFTRVKKEVDPVNFEVRTKTAVAGVRGTEFVTTVDEKKGTYLCVCEGIVEFSKPDSSANEKVTKGFDAWLNSDSRDIKPKKNASMESASKKEFSSMNF